MKLRSVDRESGEKYDMILRVPAIYSRICQDLHLPPRLLIMVDAPSEPARKHEPQCTVTLECPSCVFVTG